MGSTAYQQVIAGRVREDEQIGYFRENKITTPAGNFSTNRVGGSVAQPVVTQEPMRTENAGKIRPVTNLSATQAEIVAGNGGNAIAETYLPGSNNSAKS